MSRVLRRGIPLDPNATASEKATTRLARDGILLPDRPTWPQEKPPEDLPGVPDVDLIQMYVRMTAWTGYLATRAAAAMADERAAETALEVQEAKTLIASWGGTSKDRVTVAKAERSADPDVARMRETLEERYSMRKLLEVLATNSANDAFLVSRELTRRTSGPAPEHRAKRYHT